MQYHWKGCSIPKGVTTHRLRTAAVETRRWCQIPWSWSFRWLWHTWYGSSTWVPLKSSTYSFCFFLVFIYSFKIDSSLIQYILTTVFPPSTPPSSLPALFFIPPLLFPLQKREGLQEMATKQYKTWYNKIRQKSSYRGWTRQPNRKKSQSKQKSERYPHSHC